MANITWYNQPTGVMPLSEAVEHLFQDAFTWPRLFGKGMASGTSVGLGSNLYETDDSYIMQVVLPGVQSDEIVISVHQNVLTLRGKCNMTMPEGAKGIWVGLAGGEFHKQVTLPGEVDADQAQADYHDGILTVTLPKAQHARVRTIKVGAQPTAIEGEKK